jgi:ATP-dependent exoDNAse (exonuclease V) beta subunit
VSETTDHAARTRIRDAHDVGLFVEAGAGTGKTTALVDRVVALVAAGHGELRHLAAITFTDAAAAELKDRVRAALETVAAGTDPTYADARARADRALHQLDEAALTTLHGFAQRLLSEHPFEVGLPPGFRVLEPVEASVTFEARWARLVDAMFAQPAMEPAITTWLVGGLSVRHLRRVAFDLWAYPERLPPEVDAPPLPRLRAEELGDALDGLLTMRRERCLDDDDRLADHLDGLIPFRDALAAATDEIDALAAVFAVPQLSCRRGQEKHWTGVQTVRDACAAADTRRQAIVDEQRRGALAILAAAIVAEGRVYADDRRREGRLEFHDLLVLARDLLRDHPDARSAAAARYRWVLVDEFQDTDPLQIEIATLLTAAEHPPPGARWADIALRPGALTLVGDPKQSIYRFRSADLRVYHEARERLGLETVALVENFRSAPHILDVVNVVFDELLTEVSGVQAGHVTLYPHRDEPAGKPTVGVIGDGVDAFMVEVREQEATDVANTVRHIVDQGWLVEDGASGWRPALERDVALLIPSRTVLPALEAALERAEIPVRVESQSLVYSTAEVRDLLAVLAAVDDPTDELSIVAALRSPAFGCSDADLLAHVAGGGGWDYRRENPDASPAASPVAESLHALRELWMHRWWRGVSETVEAVVRERQLLEVAAAARRPRDRWRRVRFVMDQARAWEDAGETSLRGFLEWAGRQADEGARVNESVAPEPDDPAVRILTVHGAKGLEFPIVILAGLNTVPPNQPPPVLWGPAGPEIRLGSTKARTAVETPGYDASKVEEREHQAAERLRLLYVAMTRARDHLVVSLHHRVGRESHAAQLAPRLAAAPHQVLRPGAAPPAGRRRPGPMPESATPEARDAWRSHRAALLDRAARPLSVAATTLAELAGLERFDADDPIEGVEARPPWQRGRAGTSIGRAVHAVLQTVDLEAGAGLDATARAQALAEGVPGRVREVRDLAASVLASPTVRAAVEGGWDRWREVPVAAEVDGVLVEGFIDLLLRAPSGLVVVDYKTDRVPTVAELDAALARYSVQGAAYALALEVALGEPVTRCVFVFARQPEAVERDVIDLPGAIAAVRERVRAATVG